MPERRSVLLSWSGGKDSALALADLMGSEEWSPAGLLTTVTEGYARISMHGVRISLLEAQCNALRQTLKVVSIPPNASASDYEARMGAAMEEARAAGIDTVAFGDLFLQDVRDYREAKLRPVGMAALFPLWGRPTRVLAEAFIDAGFRAILVCVDTTQLPGSFAGREFDRTLLDDLPSTADPCGENGEFHTFVYDGPPFAETVRFVRGEAVLRDQRFMYFDLVDPA